MELTIFSDESFMQEALKEAQKAFDADEVPVGAVVVCNNKIIARAHNLTERLNDVTAHAEMQAITSAANFLNGKYLMVSLRKQEKRKKKKKNFFMTI